MVTPPDIEAQIPALIASAPSIRGFRPPSTVARLERDEQAGLADLGLRLAEAKKLTSALQAEIVPAQITIAGEHRCTCAACGRRLSSKGYYTATFRSLFGDIPI